MFYLLALNCLIWASYWEHHAWITYCHGVSGNSILTCFYHHTTFHGGPNKYYVVEKLKGHTRIMQEIFVPYYVLYAYEEFNFVKPFKHSHANVNEKFTLWCKILSKKSFKWEGHRLELHLFHSQIGMIRFPKSCWISVYQSCNILFNGSFKRSG